MTRYAGLVLVSVFLASSGLPHAAAQEQKDDRASPEKTDRSTADQNETKPRQSQKPATTFKPSERIRADSAVSFPVDI